MKYLLVYIVLTVSLYSNAQEIEVKAYCERFYYVTFSQEWGDKIGLWPFSFEALFKNDTIYVDVDDTEAFSKSIYKDAIFVPKTGEALEVIYDRIWNGGKISEKGLDKSRCFYNYIYDMLEANKTDGKIKLKSGLYIYYKYCEFTGLFVDIDKEKEFYSSSIGIEDSTWVNNVTIPIALISCKKAEKPLVILNKER